MLQNFCLPGWQNFNCKAALAETGTRCCRISVYLAGRTLTEKQHWQRPERDAEEFLITWLAEL
jgi:hypothetical protein